MLNISNKGAAIFLVTIIVVICVINFQGEIGILYKINVVDGLLLAIFTYITVIISGYVFSSLLMVLGVDLKVLENINLAVAAQFLNYFGPVRAGAIVRAIYLKRKYSFPYSRYATVAVASSLLSVFVLAVLGLLALSVLNDSTNKLYLVILCASLLLLSISPFFIKDSMSAIYNKMGRVGEFLVSAHHGLVLVGGVKKGLFLVVSLVLLQTLISAYIYMYAFKMFGVDMLYITALLISVFTSFSNLFSVTPGNIGVQEFIIASISQFLGSGFVVGVTVATVLRILHFLVVSLHAPVSFSWLSIKRSDILERAQ